MKETKQREAPLPAIDIAIDVAIQQPKINQSTSNHSATVALRYPTETIFERSTLQSICSRLTAGIDPFLARACCVSVSGVGMMSDIRGTPSSLRRSAAIICTSVQNTYEASGRRRTESKSEALYLYCVDTMRGSESDSQCAWETTEEGKSVTKKTSSFKKS